MFLYARKEKLGVVAEPCVVEGRLNCEFHILMILLGNPEVEEGGLGWVCRLPLSSIWWMWGVNTMAAGGIVRGI